MSYINAFKLFEAFFKNQPPDAKALLADVNKQKVMAALKRSKAGLPRPVPCTDEPTEEENQAKMPQSDKEKLRAIYKRLHDSPENNLPILLELKEKYPLVPSIYNYIGITYTVMQQWDRLQNILDETIRKFPGYLFGKTAFADYYLRKEDPRRIPLIFDKKLELSLLYPERDVFHVSEVRAFYSVIGAYYARINKTARALYCYFLLEEIAPDHLTTERVGNEILCAEMEKMRLKMSKAGRMRRVRK
jgi:tetratricopeptide (TPR) repeat protein